MDDERARRVIEAMLANLDNWAACAEEIAEHALPITNNKRRALHLAISIRQARIALCKLAGLPDP